MIFVCLGTKRFSFNRLLEELDNLIEQNKIDNDVLAQIGQSTYIPKNYKYKRFMDPDEYENNVNKADIVITHGGTGAIVKALKAEKQIIAVPRLEKYGEHSDDHQLQIVSFFSENGYVHRVDQMTELMPAIENLTENPIMNFFSSEGKIVEIIEEFIQKGI